MKRLSPLAATLAILALCPPAWSQNGMIQLPPMLENSFGTPLAGVNVSVCDQLTTSAASVTNNIASYTVSATTGFAAGQTLFVSGFTGADAYFNVSGTIVSLTGNTLSIALSHGNASASSNGSLYAEGNSTVPCAPLSTLFTDNTGAATTSNPTTSTPVGAVIGWVAPGLHELQTYGSTIPTSIQIFSVGCVPSASTATCGVYLNGNNAWTGNETHAGTEAFAGGIVGAVTFTGTATLPSPVLNGTPTGTGIPTITLKKGSGSGNYTSTSTSFVDVDATNLAYTVTIPTGWKLAVAASGTAQVNTSAVQVQVSLFDSATLVQGAFNPPAANVSFSSFALNYVINGDGNSHTVKLQFSTSNASDAVAIVNTTSTFLPTMVFILTPSN